MSMFDRARALYQEGRAAEAEVLCRRLLRSEPASVPLLNLLAVICAQSRRAQEAAELFARVVKIDPGSAIAHSNLGTSLAAQGSHEAALASFEKALALAPGHVPAHMGGGGALRALRQYEAALARFERAAQLDPVSAEAHFARGNVLMDLGRLEEAVAAYTRAIALRPAHASAGNNRGIACLRLKQHAAALESFDAALRCKPDHAQAHSNRGLALSGLQRYPEALASYETALALQPRFAEAHYNRGNALCQLEQYHAAVASYDRAIELDPRQPIVHVHRGNALHCLRDHPAAVKSYDRAIELQPECGDWHYNRGNALRALHAWEAAAASFDKAFELHAQGGGLAGLRLNTRGYLCSWSGFEEAVGELAAAIGRGEPASEPMTVHALLDAPAVHRQAAAVWARCKLPAAQAPAPIPRYPAHERLRVGYFSADLRNHPIAVLAAQTFETHDRSRFEVTAFAFGPEPDERDEMRLRLRPAFERFVDVHSQSDREIAGLARRLEIDIAVDLGGYSADARPGIFAARAAPVQVSYLGYLGTMSADFMDYLIADAILVPEASQACYTERIVYLPSYQPNDSKRPIATRVFTRAELGLPATGFVFCCFNACYKLHPATFAGWMRILARVPDSVLFLLADSPRTCENLRQAARDAGVAPERLVFGGRLPFAQYLARYRAADLFLDTLPYNAGTTASDALWAGLPVLTRVGEAFAARMAASVLTAIGLTELVTSTQEEYERLAGALATQPGRLAGIRDKLARNRLTTRLFDTPAHTRSLEAAYLAMHARHVAGLPPDHIRVD